MYAVPIHALSHLALIMEDPRQNGYDGPVEKVDVQFPDDVSALNDFYAWPKESDAPEPCLGRDPDDPSRYKVFRSDRERRNEGFGSCVPNFSIHGTWSEVAKLFG